MPRLFFILDTFYINIINILICIKDLIISAQEPSARILFRSFIEYSDQLIYLLLNHESWKDFFIDSSDDNELSKNWFKNFKPSIISQYMFNQINKIYGKEMEKIYKDIRTAYYKRNSQYTHVSINAIYHSAFVLDDDNFQKKLGGCYDSSMKDFLFNVIFYIYLNQFIIIHIIVSDYSLPLRHFNQNGNISAFLFGIGNDLIYELLKLVFGESDFNKAKEKYEQQKRNDA
ncbi:hypothetical protein K7I13_07250 [Brucepastera parasyntrophica]|uniref:hypothetical protein n=1 Tax=Brucepastera parasyntrophica TaxID=2880008 RepID=UPI00210E8F69|nr:hypothetical protein [Brucepastera parasyntrophica]ULQ61040.1 hypothetical protein K7I13_07250 [Brucepastera parasyntrophica]